MPIRKISTEGRDLISGATGSEPVLDFVAIDQLIIDDSYQRAIEKRGWVNILKIATHFDWAKFSPLMVSKRQDGMYAIIDGQHRAHAAALRGIVRVPALISDLSSEQQASAFSWINGTVTALTPNQIFKAALAAFEPWAVQCDAVVTRAGCKLMTSNSSHAAKKPGQVFPISTVRKFVDDGHSQHLVAVLQGLKNSASHDNISYYGSLGLNSLVPAAITNGITMPDNITSFLNEHDLEDIASRVRKIMDLPENRNKTFKSLFGQSVAVLMKQFTNKENIKAA